METDLLFGRNEKERNERRLRLLITLRSYKPKIRNYHSIHD